MVTFLYSILFSLDYTCVSLGSRNPRVSCICRVSFKVVPLICFDGNNDHLKILKESSNNREINRKNVLLFNYYNTLQ